MTAEICNRFSMPGLWSLASMRPRSNDRGNTEKEIKAFCDFYGFNEAAI